VHMGGAVLEVEEGRIEPGQAVAGGHGLILPHLRPGAMLRLRKECDRSHT
jgi:hypothetical protein